MARSKVTDVPMALAVKIELFKRGCFRLHHRKGWFEA